MRHSSILFTIYYFQPRGKDTVGVVIHYFVGTDVLVFQELYVGSLIFKLKRRPVRF